MTRLLTAACAVASAFVCFGHGAFAKEEPHHRVSRDDDPIVQLADEPQSGPKLARRAKLVAAISKKSAPSKHKKKRLVRIDPPNATWRKYHREPWRRGYVSVIGHGKTWSGYLVDAEGEVPPRAREELSAALSSWRTGKTMLIDAHLMQLVADVSDEFGGRPIRIVSGYREVSYAPGSKHKAGQAFDFSIPGVPNEALRDYLKTLPDVGVGYYPNSTHVHLDVRDKNTYWVDYSRPGEHPLYAWQRRVNGLTPEERALAAALESIGTESAKRTSSLERPVVPRPTSVALRHERASFATRGASAVPHDDSDDEEQEPSAEPSKPVRERDAVAAFGIAAPPSAAFVVDAGAPSRADAGAAVKSDAGALLTR